MEARQQLCSLRCEPISPEWTDYPLPGQRGQAPWGFALIKNVFRHLPSVCAYVSNTVSQVMDPETIIHHAVPALLDACDADALKIMEIWIESDTVTISNVPYGMGSVARLVLNTVYLVL